MNRHIYSYITHNVNTIKQVFIRHPIVRVRFRKLNGDERIIVGTASEDIIPEKHHPKGHGMVNYIEAFPIFDLIKQEWRAFKPSSVIEIEGIDGGVVEP